MQWVCSDQMNSLEFPSLSDKIISFNTNKYKSKRLARIPTQKFRVAVASVELNIVGVCINYTSFSLACSFASQASDVSCRKLNKINDYNAHFKQIQLNSSCNKEHYIQTIINFQQFLVYIIGHAIGNMRVSTISRNIVIKFHSRFSPQCHRLN